MGGRPYTNTKKNYPLVRRMNRTLQRKYRRALERQRDRELLSRIPEMIEGKPVAKVSPK